MPSPFSKKNVPGGIANEINARGSRQGILWAAKRFPWIHVTSLSSGCTNERYISLSSIKGGPLYEQNYIRPYPVVTQVEVKKQGELGTTRRATISITAFTDQQLEELSKCYFIPRMGVRVEWGWSDSATGSGNPPILGNRTLTDAQAICQINKSAEAYTNYSGLQGVVGNFTYNLNQNGFWDCTLEVTAATEAVGGVKVSEYSCDCAREYQNETPEGGSGTPPTVEKRSTLYTFFKDLYESFYYSSNVYQQPLTSTAATAGYNIAIALYKYNGPARTEKGGDDSPWYEGEILGVTINQPDTTEAFISWSTLESAINRYAIPTSGNEFVLGRVASKNMKLKSHPSLESSDPRVCIIPGTPKASTIARKTAGVEFNAINNDQVVLDNIMINVIFLMNELRQVEEQKGTLYTFLSNVLKRINDVCGGLWEFELVSTTEDCLDPKKYPTISVIDAKIYEAGETFLLPALPLANTQSVLRDLKLDMKMTDQMKTQALYSNARQIKTKTDSGGGCGANGFAPFGMGNDEFTNLAVPKATDPPNCDCKNASPSAPPAQPTVSELFEDMADNVTDSTVQACRSALIEEYAKSIEAGSEQHCVGMPLPFEFGFTLDGIGGFEFGQIVSCDRIPAQVRDAYDFQITAVEHSVTANDWTTTVNTVCRYKG